MRNPRITLHTSIFEPLYFDQEELHFPSSMPNTQASSSYSTSDNWLSHATFSIAPPSMKRAAATIFNTPDKDSSCDVMASESAPCSVTATTKHAHVHGLPSPCDPGMCSPSGSSSAIAPPSSPICPPIRSHSASDVVNPDDGSVASKLLTSITKSISSPSLLACCKESARETPYQKSLRLRTMKLEYCAEELGSESSEGSLHGGDYFSSSIFHSLDKVSSSQSTRDFSADHQESEGSSAKLISVRSFPNLGCGSLVSKPSSYVNKQRSFPPPLSYTLPRSASLVSFSYSLRASREDGRFVLKEFKVPCRQYFQASRKDGRLTLQCLTSTDEDMESMPTSDDKADIEQHSVLQEDDKAGVSGDVGTSDQANDGSEVESAAKSMANFNGGFGMCGTEVKGSKKGVDDTGEKGKMKELADCLLMAEASSNGDSSSANINGKINFMSYAASTSSSKMKSNFKAAERKAIGKALRTRSSPNQHLQLNTSSRHSPQHPPGKSPCDATRLTQYAENVGSESKSASGAGKILQGFEIAATSSQASGHGFGKSSSSTISFKDVGKCLMENESKLVASLGLEVCGGKRAAYEGEERTVDKNLYKNSGEVMESTMHKGIRSINTGVRETISVLDGNKRCEHSVRCGAVREGKCDVNIVDDSPRSCFSGSSLHFGVEISPSAAASDSKVAPMLPMQTSREWLHCKEIFLRKLTKGTVMKLHCVA